MNFARIATRFLYANLLPDELFRCDISIAMAKKLFSTYVRLVEIENHNYCNRVCSFCPNATLDRRSKLVQIQDSVFERIVSDLSSIEYNGTITWARYHEPFADESFFERLKIVRKALPQAFLYIITNGDYLDREKLSRLEQIGIDWLYINVYLPNGKEHNQKNIDSAIKKLLKHTCLRVGDKIADSQWRMNGTTFIVSMTVPNYFAGGLTMSSRGGLINSPIFRDYQRTSVCFSPLQHVVIDYNGKGMLCCQVRSDAPEHQSSIICDLNEEGKTLFHMYRALGNARRVLFIAGPKGGICKTCTQNAEGPYKFGRVMPVSWLFNHIPGTCKVLEIATKRRKKWGL